MAAGDPHIDFNGLNLGSALGASPKESDELKFKVVSLEATLIQFASVLQEYKKQIAYQAGQIKQIQKHLFIKYEERKQTEDRFDGLEIDEDDRE